MTAGIVGLGLIGGSLAKAYRAHGARVLAFDTEARCSPLRSSTARWTPC